MDYNKTNCKITLNNEKSFNALDYEMIREIKGQFEKWIASKKFPQVLLLTSNPGAKAFCAGGDIKTLYTRREQSKEDVTETLQFFKEEYELDWLLANTKKLGTVSCAFMQGIVMGGGVGISAYSNFRIITDKTVFAMPETMIGLFPDVGTMSFLSKMSNYLGFALAVGGLRLKGREIMYAGLADYYVPQSAWEEVQKQVFEIESNSGIRNLNRKHRFTN